MPVPGGGIPPPEGGGTEPPGNCPLGSIPCTDEVDEGGGCIGLFVDGGGGPTIPPGV